MFKFTLESNAVLPPLNLKLPQLLKSDHNCSSGENNVQNPSEMSRNRMFSQDSFINKSSLSSSLNKA